MYFHRLQFKIKWLQASLKRKKVIVFGDDIFNEKASWGYKQKTQESIIQMDKKKGRVENEEATIEEAPHTPPRRSAPSSSSITLSLSIMIPSSTLARFSHRFLIQLSKKKRGRKQWKKKSLQFRTNLGVSGETKTYKSYWLK